VLMTGHYETVRPVFVTPEDLMLTDMIFARHRSPALVLLASQSLSPRFRDRLASSRAVSQISNATGSRGRGQEGKKPVSVFIFTSKSAGLRCPSVAEQRGPRTDEFNNDMASRSTCGGEGRQLVISISGEYVVSKSTTIGFYTVGPQLLPLAFIGPSHCAQPRSAHL